MNPWEKTIIIDLPPEPPQPAVTPMILAMGDAIRDQIRTCLIGTAEDCGMSHEEAVAWADVEMDKPLNIRIGPGVV